MYSTTETVTSVKEVFFYLFQVPVAKRIQQNLPLSEYHQGSTLGQYLIR
jgi:hypothetical protein